jgi:DNA processing protein
MTNIVRDVVALSLMRGIGRKALLRLLAEFPGKQFDTGALERVLLTHKARIGATTIASELLPAARRRAEGVIDASLRTGIEIITILDRSYPERLARTAAPPPVLYVKGNRVSLNSGAAIAIIGTREPTAFGVKCAFKLGSAFAAEATVVSGLARGCDTQGHLGCLEAGGTAVAVLAHGLDRVYPRENTELAVAIAETGGCLVSEYPIGTRPFRSYFVERNKLQAALSDAVIVVETDINGGTMHTVKFAVEQHKPVACVQHPPKYSGSPQARGNAHLLSAAMAVPIVDTRSLESFWKSALLSTGRGATSEHELELSLNGW